MTDLGAAVIDLAHEVKNAYRSDHLSEPDRFRVSAAAEAAIRDEFRRRAELPGVSEDIAKLDLDGPMQLWGLPVEVDDALTGTEIKAVSDRERKP